MKRGIVFLSALLLSVMGVNVCSREPLTFEQRVKAQEAIERVYYNHRIWPKENPQPKPPFEKKVPKEVIEAKVNDYLKKCSALDKFWQRPIVASQLQAEMDRMAKGSKDPATALNNDPYLIAECLARPVLADRLVHNWYANDEKFHKEAREKAEEALKTLTPENFASLDIGEYSTVTYRLENENENSSEENLEEQSHVIRLSQDEWEKTLAKYPVQGVISEIFELDKAFAVGRVTCASTNEIQIEARNFQKRSFAEWWEKEAPKLEMASYVEVASFSFAMPRMEAICESDWIYSSLNQTANDRYYHTAVWTGAELIIWGGYNSTFLNTGVKYYPSIDTSVATSTATYCPSPRDMHTAIWTGSEMIIWGGYIGTVAPYYEETGGKYNPTSDTWVATSTPDNINMPRRRLHTAVWTGTEMIVWGGESHWPVYPDAGGRYNPSNDTWGWMSSNPLGRRWHTALWTGTEMIIWGGYSQFYTEYKNDGWRYNPSANGWTPISTGTNVPDGRCMHSAVIIDDEMIIWGGRYDDTGDAYLNDGGRYNLISDTWDTISSDVNCPSARGNHTAIAIGNEMIIWGGNSYYSPSNKQDGGCYSPSTNTWSSISVETNCPSARTYHTATWIGNEMIIWGGTPLAEVGGIYCPPPMSMDWVLSVDQERFWYPQGITTPDTNGSRMVLRSLEQRRILMPLPRAVITPSVLQGRTGARWIPKSIQ